MRDIEGAVGRMGSLMGSWRGLCLLVTTNPFTETMISMVKRALNNVIANVDLRDGLKIVARRALVQWHGPSKPTTGVRVNFDSDLAAPLARRDANGRGMGWIRSYGYTSLAQQAFRGLRWRITNGPVGGNRHG